MTKFGPKELGNREMRERKQARPLKTPTRKPARAAIANLAPSAAGSGDCAGDRTPVSRGDKPSPASSAVEQSICNREAGGSNPSLAIKKKRAPRGSFDRTAYQRELMRKRRAAEKIST